MPAIPALIAAAGTAYAADRQNKGAKESAKAQSGQNEAERQFILAQTNMARDDAGRIYGNQAQNSMTGGQAALDIMRGSFPQQAGLFNQSQNNAMAAILGGQVTPFAQPDFSFIHQSLPQYKYMQQVAPSGSVQYGPEQAAAQQNNFSNALQGFGERTGFGGGKFMGLGDKRHFEADTIFNNPLRLKQSTADKINPVKSTKKLLKKLF